MKYSEKQIEAAKKAYNNFLRFETAEKQSCFELNPFEAERRAEFHNNTVERIKNGNVELEREWKLFFLNEQAKADQKANEIKQKLANNKDASSDLLAQVKKSGKKLADYYSFVKSNKQFAKEFYSKSFSQKSVDAFLSL